MSAGSPEARLAYEAQARPRYAVVAAVAGLLLIAVVVVTVGGPHAKVDEATLRLITDNKRATRDIIGAIVTAIDSLAIAGALIFLSRQASARLLEDNPSRYPPMAAMMAGVGGLLTAVPTVVLTVLTAQKAHQFVTSGDQSYQQANQLTSAAGMVVMQYLGLLGTLLLTIALVLTAMQAMRAGLLTRFMGYVGMITGAVIIIPTLVVVEVYWFLALAVLLAGRWPSGTPPAWRSGRMERWPSAQELREQRIREAGGAEGKLPRGAARAGTASGAKAKDKVPAAATATASGAAGTAHAGAKRKRKRKR